MKEKQLFEIGSTQISFVHRNLVWILSKPTDPIYDQFEHLKNTTLTITTHTIDSESDDSIARRFLFKALIQEVQRPDGSIVFDEPKENWIDKIDFKFQKEITNYLGDVSKVDPEMQDISFGSPTKEVIIEAMHHWIETEDFADETKIKHFQQRLQMTHIFSNPDIDQEREYRKVSQGKTSIQRGRREQSKIVRNNLSGYRKLYAALIQETRGYGLNGDPVGEVKAGLPLIIDQIDSIHKMVAIDALFAEEGAEELKN